MQTTQIILKDDIDGSEATETVSFGLDGTNYLIELNEEHARILRDGLSSFINVARVDQPLDRNAPAVPVGGLGSKRSKRIRSWAIREGYDVNHYGRVPNDIVAAYYAANPHVRA